MFFLSPLFAADESAATEVARQAFEFGRIQANTDWILPGVVFAVVVAFVCWMYWRDSVELRPGVGFLLAFLRIAAFAGLLAIYLKPQWRNESVKTETSIVHVAVDVSQSMAGHDSQSSPIPAEPTRSQQVAALLSGGVWLDALRATHDVTLSRFDQAWQEIVTLRKLSTEPPPAAADGGETAAPPKPLNWEQEIAPRGAETRLFERLQTLIETHRGDPIAGLIVYTDGADTTGRGADNLVRAAVEAGVKIFPVGMGSDKKPKSASVGDFAVPQRAYPNDAFAVSVAVSANGYDGQMGVVELFSRPAETGATPKIDGAQLEATQEVALLAGGAKAQVTFQLKMKDIGSRDLIVRLKPLAEDNNPADNVSYKRLEIVDRKDRVLLFAGGPSREYQFLRSLLRRDKGVVVDVLLQTSQEGTSQDAEKILTEFPATREELFAYDAIVCVDPDWNGSSLTEDERAKGLTRGLTKQQVDLVENWVFEQAGGLILMPQAVNIENWTQDPQMAKIRNLYPVEFHKGISRIGQKGEEFRGKEVVPLSFSRAGLEAPFLWVEDSAVASQQAWDAFPGVYGYFPVKKAKDGATVYATLKFSGVDGEGPIFMAGQIYGAGRVFYVGSAEMYRLRAQEDAYFERLYTKLLRHVTQNRLLRGTPRGSVFVEHTDYQLGDVVSVQAKLTNEKLEPLDAADVPLEITHPDSTRQTIKLNKDAVRAGLFTGQFIVRKEGLYRMEVPLPDAVDVRLAAPIIQVRMPDLESRLRERQDKVLQRLAADTGGAYFVGIADALGQGGNPALVGKLEDMSRQLTLTRTPESLWDQPWVLWTICGLLCLEWLIRRLSRLA